MSRSFYPRFGWPIVIVCLLLLPLTVCATVKTLQSTTNEARDWLPRHYPETMEYEWFTQHFGGDDFVLVTWEGCTLDDPRLAAFKAAMERQQGALFGHTITGRSMLDELTEQTLRLDPRQATERLSGLLIGPDGEQTCAIVYLAEAGWRDLHRSIRTIEETAVSAGAPQHTLRLAGPPVINEAINVSGIETLHREAVLSGILGLLISWWLFRTLRLTVAVAVTGMYSVTASMAMIWLSGVPMNSILITTAPLVFVAATSGAIHLTNYYRDAAKEGGEEGATQRAVQHAWTPLGLASSTTAIGLLSLLYSDLSPIRQFGIFSAIGIALGLLLTVLFLPAVIEVWPIRSAGEASQTATGAMTTFRRNRLADGVVLNNQWFSIAGLGLVLAGGAAMTRMQTSVDLMRLFRSDAPLIQDYAWLEQNLGYLMPVEAVVRFPKDDESLTMVDKVQRVREIEQALRSTPHVGSSLSAATFVPDPSRGSGAWLRRAVLLSRLQRKRDRLEEYGFIASADGEELWRISLRVGPFADLDYGTLLEELRTRVQSLGHQTSNSQEHSVTLTGIAPVVHKARLSLLRDLLFGLATDLVLIFVALVVLMRHWSSGLLVLLVSMLPTTVVFGALVCFGVVLEIGALMAPCVALGVTVDDVIHFLLWFRRGIQQGLDQRQAVLLAYQGCARAMVQSWLILGMGLGVLLVSSFVPNAQFGAAMVALLTVGLVGNLLFLPALLAGPLGRVIADNVASQSKHHETDAQAGASAVRPS